MIVVSNCCKPLLSLMIGDSVLSFQSRFSKSRSETRGFQGVALSRIGTKIAAGPEVEEFAFLRERYPPLLDRGHVLYMRGGILAVAYFFKNLKTKSTASTKHR